MKDIELLEMAAKAACYEVRRQTLNFGFIRADARGGPNHWNPLEDDGDALQLSRDLLIDIHWMVEVSPASGPCAVKASRWTGEWAACEDVSGRFDGNQLRRAIVTVAAQVGMKKP